MSRSKAKRPLAFRHRVPRGLGPLVSLIKEYVVDCAYKGSFPACPSAREPALTGQCSNASTLFWIMAGDKKMGWKCCSLPARIWPLGGPHAFIEHVPSGTIVDPTAGQYSRWQRIPYEKAEYRGNAGVRIDSETGLYVPHKPAIAALAKILADTRSASAIQSAYDWGIAHGSTP